MYIFCIIYISSSNLNILSYNINKNNSKFKNIGKACCLCVLMAGMCVQPMREQNGVTSKQNKAKQNKSIILKLRNSASSPLILCERISWILIWPQSHFVVGIDLEHLICLPAPPHTGTIGLCKQFSIHAEERWRPKGTFGLWCSRWYFWQQSNLKQHVLTMRWMNKRDAVYTHSKILFSLETDKHLIYAETWRELEDVLLSKACLSLERWLS